MIYLVEKNRLPASAYDDLKTALVDLDYVIEEVPFTGEIVEAMRRISGTPYPICQIASLRQRRSIWGSLPSAGTDASAPPMCERSGEGIPNTLRLNCLVRPAGMYN